MIKPSSPYQRIIFPLDLPTLGEALEYVELLKGSVGLFKIGLELFIASGPETVAAVKEMAPRCGIFLDLKLHDIPATVTNAMASASVLGADFITVHCDDGGPLLGTNPPSFIPDGDTETATDPPPRRMPR